MTLRDDLLNYMARNGRISFSTRASRDSPFFFVRDRFSDSGQSIVEQYEFMVLLRG